MSVYDRSINKQKSSFGLNSRGVEELSVNNKRTLVVKNTSGRDVSVRFTINEKIPTSIIAKASKPIRFTLENTSDQSIPLLIPSVMNPNLSPNSQSGVSLKLGQTVLFRYKGKKQVFLVVDESIEQGTILDVAALLKKRKSEIDSKKSTPFILQQTGL